MFSKFIISLMQILKSEVCRYCWCYWPTLRCHRILLQDLLELLFATKNVQTIEVSTQEGEGGESEVFHWVAVTLEVEDIVGHDPASLVRGGDVLPTQEDAGERVRTQLRGNVEVVNDLVEVKTKHEADMEEADGSEDSVEVGGGPLMDPGVAVSHGDSDQTEAVGQTAENQQGDLPHWHRRQLTLELQQGSNIKLTKLT